MDLLLEDQIKGYFIVEGNAWMINYLMDIVVLLMGLNVNNVKYFKNKLEVFMMY